MKTGKHRVGNATKPSGQTLHTTCPLDRRWLALDLAAFLFASILAPPASLLKAECKQWDVSGNWVLKQSNGFAIELRLNQNGKELTGTADAKSGGYSDKVQGNIEGNDFYVSIPWGFKRTRVGVYRGTIGSSGRIDGTTYDEKHPQVKATWFSTTAMKCADAAPAAKVLEHPGKVLGSPGKSPAPAATPSRPTAPPQAPPAASAPTIAANPRVVQVDDSQDEERRSSPGMPDQTILTPKSWSR
jgi:hypothetical protein